MKIYNKKGITFIGAITLLVTILGFHEIFYADSVLTSLSPRAITMIILYVLIALASEDYIGVIDMIERIWAINTNGQKDVEKLALIKSFLEVSVARWDKYCCMYNEIVENNKTTKGKVLRRYALKIPKGTINLKQFIWIVGYIVYNILKAQLDLLIPLGEWDFLIDFIGLGFFIFTSGSIIGLRDFMNNIFDSIKPSTAKNAKHSLSLLESHIIFGARQYGFLRGRLDIKEKLEEKIKEGK